MEDEKNLWKGFGNGVLSTLLLAIIIILLFGIFSKECKSQEKSDRYPNTVYAMFQTPPGFSMGARLDFEFTRFGIYTSMLRGDYEFDTGEYIRDHTRIALGGYLPIVYPLNGTNSNMYNNLGIGIVYHEYGDKNFNTDNYTVFSPLSLEIGFGSKINRLAFAINFDFIKGESVICMGFNF